MSQLVVWFSGIENISVMYSGAIPLSDLNVIINSRLFSIDCIFDHLSIWEISEDRLSKPELVMTRAALFCNLICVLLSKTKKVSSDDKTIILKSDRSLFGRIIIIGQSRKIDVRELLKFSLGPLPWFLASAEGFP